MEIEIQSKKENPMLNRTEVYFIVRHDGEPTPRRERVRVELAEKLNVKKDLIIVNAMNSKFGLHLTQGYAKVYANSELVLKGEREHILKRNKTGGKKEKEPENEQSAVKQPAEHPSESPAEQPTEPKEEEKKE